MPKKVSFPVTGNSMLPTIKPGKRVYVQQKKKIDQGNIIVFINTEGKLIIHRAIRIKGILFTIGDNNLEFDTFGIKKYIGKAQVKENYINKWLRTFKYVIKAKKMYKKAKKQGKHSFNIRK